MDSIKKSKMSDSWYLFLLSGILLLLYTISRIISLSRRIKEVESRPPVDEIILRGLIRQEVENHTEKLDSLIQEKLNSIELDVQLKKEERIIEPVEQQLKIKTIVQEEKDLNQTNISTTDVDVEKQITNTKKRSKASTKKKSTNETKNVNELDLDSLETYSEVKTLDHKNNVQNE